MHKKFLRFLPNLDSRMNHAAGFGAVVFSRKGEGGRRGFFWKSDLAKTVVTVFSGKYAAMFPTVTVLSGFQKEGKRW